MAKSGLIFRLAIGVALVVFVVSGCDLFDGPGQKLQDDIKQRVQERRQQWEDQGIENYRLVYSQQVGETLVDSVHVRAEQGSVDSIDVSQDVPKEDLLVGTVDSFFDLIEARIGEEESQFTADFDQDQGFPTSYTADFEDDRPSQTVLTIALEDSLEKAVRMRH